MRYWLATVLLITSSILLISCRDSSSDSNEPATSNQPLPKTGINILFIGNSLTYTNDLPAMLERMLLIADVEVGVIESQTLGGYGLPDHWVRQETRDWLGLEGWDIVVLQQGPSATEGRPYLLEYAPLFTDEIIKSGGQTAMYMVWPSKARFFDFAGVSDSYQSAAVLVDGLLFPAGEAWLAAWETDPNIQLYGADNFHPSLLGTYLAALTMFEQITQIDLNELEPIIPATGGDVRIDESLAKILQDSAKKANQQFALVYP